MVEISLNDLEANKRANDDEKKYLKEKIRQETTDKIVAFLEEIDRCVAGWISTYCRRGLCSGNIDYVQQQLVEIEKEILKVHKIIKQIKERKEWT